MDPLLLSAFVGVTTILVLFSGISIGIGLLVVSGLFLIMFSGMRSLELMPEIFFGKLDSFALLSIPMFILMGSTISSTRAGADLYEALERWLTKVPGGLVVSNLGACGRDVVQIRGQDGANVCPNIGLTWSHYASHRGAALLVTWSRQPRASSHPPFAACSPQLILPRSLGAARPSPPFRP